MNRSRNTSRVRSSTSTPAPLSGVVAQATGGSGDGKQSYAIGVTEPVSMHVDTAGAGKIKEPRICELVKQIFPLKPGGIIDYLNLRRTLTAGATAQSE